MTISDTVPYKDYVKFRKTGNSYAITIPPDAMKELGWKEGDRLFIQVTGEKSGKKLTVEAESE